MSGKSPSIDFIKQEKAPKIIYKSEAFLKYNCNSKTLLLCPFSICFLLGSFRFPSAVNHLIH